MKSMSEIKDPELVASIERWVNAERERAVKPLTTKITDLEHRLAVMHAEVSELKAALPMRDMIIQQLVESTNKANKRLKEASNATRHSCLTWVTKCSLGYGQQCGGDVDKCLCVNHSDDKAAAANDVCTCGHPRSEHDEDAYGNPACHVCMDYAHVFKFNVKTKM